jgi:hypothetical protein
VATNDWCSALGIERPDLAEVKDHNEANTYARLIVALLERGEEMTLPQVAKRFEEVGIADYDRALRSLQRCKPRRPPVYRDGDCYSLDPYDVELDLWVFRLGLRPPRAPRVANARKLAVMTRALLVGFPAKAPRAVALLDVGEHCIHTFVDEEVDELRRRVATYDIVGAEEVRSLLRALGVETNGMRLAELGPPQRTRTLNKRGRTLRITTALLVQGSCGIGRPFGDPKKLRDYLANGDRTKLRGRLEADVKSLYALYEYGRLHRTVRLRWGFLDEPIPAPWAYHDERSLYDLMEEALERGEALEVVVGNAPGWSDPWSRAQRVRVEREQSGWGSLLVDEDGYVIDEADVQRARLVPGG